MDIIVGKTAGFCYGVKRAVEGAKEETKKEKEIFCLGEIVHNKQVIEELKKDGMIFIDNIKDAKNKVIVRAHGVKKQIYEEVNKNDIKLIDYTCPNVLKIHEIAEEYSDKGYYIFLCGSKNHPENIGTMSYCGNNYFVIQREEDTLRALDKLKRSGIKKLLLISQTTYSLEKFYIIEEIIKNELEIDVELVVKNTICKATELRQKETEKISKKVDCMIIIGGTNSSNTKKLYEIAKNNCKNCMCVETEAQLNLRKIENQDTIGIMAGASTPQKSIENVVEAIKNL